LLIAMAVSTKRGTVVGPDRRERHAMIELMNNACHEAGHVVAALAVGRCVESVWVRPNAGCTRFELLPELASTTQVRQQLLIDVAGYAADAIAILADPVPLRFRRADSQKVHDISRNLRELGVLRGILPAVVLDQRSDEVQTWNTVCLLPGSAAELLAEVERAETRAEELLRQRWRCVQELACELARMDDGHLTGPEVLKIVVLAGGVAPLATDC
jgi:hypothetical protein